MSVNLTQEQRQAIVNSGGAPVEVIGEDIRCYLIVAEEFEKMKKLIKAEVIDPSFFEFDDEDFDTRNANDG